MAVTTLKLLEELALHLRFSSDVLTLLCNLTQAGHHPDHIDEVLQKALAEDIQNCNAALSSFMRASTFEPLKQ